MESFYYILRRVGLMIPTFLGITVVCFVLCQFVPGGPVEQMMMKMRGMEQSGGGEVATGSGEAGSVISEKQREELIAYFGFDKPVLVRYWNWLVHDGMGMKQDSYKYTNKKVYQLIRERMPVSLTFWIWGTILSYVVCIPLGIAKAIKHEKVFDFASSAVVFVGYAIPPFAFGMVLKLLFCGMNENLWDFFPLGGFHSENFDALSAWGQFKDVGAHMFLPLLCYMIGGFAVTTLLMKNSLLEQINQDYVRTVLAKGCSMNRAVWGHAVRNALIPIVTGLGSIIPAMLSGSILIERVFEIPGMGMLSYDAILTRDYPVFMGLMALTSVLTLIGRLVSDILYMGVDPRISLN
jgi:microcin C transport system permease protein